MSNMSINLKILTKSIVAVIHLEGLSITGTHDHEQFLGLKNYFRSLSAPMQMSSFGSVVLHR
jgi:hypothetical protein